jgi:hypothetical protein
MWETDSLWVEVAIVSVIFALGNILFGHFEERTPKIRRVSKYLVTLLIICGISQYIGREIAFSVLASFILPVLYIHAYYLPRKIGVNGWTGEPKRKYYEFRNWDKNLFSK